MGNKPSARAVGPRNAHLPHRRLLRRPNRGWVKNINPEVQISNHGIPSWPGLMVICGLVVGQKCLENEPLTSKRNGQMQHGSIAILQNNPAGGIKAPLCSEKFKVQGSKFKVNVGCAPRTSRRDSLPLYDLRVGHRPMRNCLQKSFVGCVLRTGN